MRRDPSFEREFRDVFEARFDSLYRYLDRLSGDPALAADLAQEAFVRLFRRGSMPRDESAWLATVATNLLRNEHRTRVGRRQALERWRPTAAHGRPPETPGEGLERAEERAATRRALEALEPTQRELLLLRYEGYSYRELAAATGVAESSVGTLLARARQAFKKALGGTHDA